MPKNQQTGTAMVTEKTPARAKRDKKKYRTQEELWASRSGPITTTYLCICPRPECKADTHNE